LLVLSFIVANGFAMMGWHGIGIEAMRGGGRHVLPDGRVPTNEMNPATGQFEWKVDGVVATQEQIDQIQWQRDVIPLSDLFRWDVQFVMPAVVLSLHGLLFGLAIGVVVWFWKPLRRYLFLLVPLPGLVVMIAVARSDGRYADIWRLLGNVFTLVTLPLMFWIGVGVFFSLAAGRLVVLMFLPKRVRQHFMFLWTVDGKTLRD
jgi:hypothetical protein